MENFAIAHVHAARLMTAASRDRFDRLPAGQALLEGPTPVTADPAVLAPAAPWAW